MGSQTSPSLAKQTLAMDMRCWLVTALPPLAILGLVCTFPPHAHTATQICGLLLAFFSLLMLTLARLQLGAAFSVTAQAKRLVTTGIYRHIRNPIYVFSGLVLVGIALCYGRPSLLAGLVVIVPVQWSRARREESVLEAAFGDEYRAYRAQTWF